ncbi:MFS transporter [Amycolatopsis cynarae]|uniref:MFS transporter n=1 Tax=Amycolatopsis cynarae TaxID=2995223 RepID=A0ABY7AXT3_9PSEU|nr:MFS transporter [Amycolatopsis sp. HUAS 11-8]WAL63428.1 MFS transporter [Amycolatopsis sp. HUAS 11-8]
MTSGRAGRPTLPRTVSFWAVAVSLGLLLFAASTPSPMYVLYQQRWGFSPIVLTVVFAVYVLCLLLALVCTGTLCDHIGRRPVLFAALLLQAAAMVVFAEAGGVGTLIVARVVQGLATGLATGAMSASLIDLQPSSRPRLGAQVASIAPSLGLGAGALGSGLLVEHGPYPTQLIYWLLAALFVLAAATALFMPETAEPDGRWLPALRPRVVVPGSARSLFVAIAPSLFAFWSLSGLYLSLGASVTGTLLHSGSHLTAGLVITVLACAGALTSSLTSNWPAGRALLSGSVALIAGVVLILDAVHTGSELLFFLGTAIAGFGFGPAFSGAFKVLTAASPAAERSGVVAAIYVVSYLGMSLPALAAGAVVRSVGLVTTATAYGLGIIVLAVIASAAYLGASRRREPAPAAVPAAPPCPGTVALHASAHQ